MQEYFDNHPEEREKSTRVLQFLDDLLGTIANQFNQIIGSFLFLKKKNLIKILKF